MPGECDGKRCFSNSRWPGNYNKVFVCSVNNAVKLQASFNMT
ncbi:MAG: hypothetical protein K0S32_1046 [Bacteroidetes bacterium]|nr:hypothetical protein [Bacteroidota bacterium]